MKTISAQVLCAALLGAFLLWYGLRGIGVAQALEIVRYGTKPVFYAVYLAAFYFLVWRLIQSDFRRKPARQLVLFGTALLLTLFLTSREPFGFKVVADEYVTVLQSKSLHARGTSDFPTGTFPIYGEVKPTGTLVDKRPAAFSAFVALFHDLTGYRWWNVFVVNVFVAFALLYGMLRAVDQSPRDDIAKKSGRTCVTKTTPPQSGSPPVKAGGEPGDAGAAGLPARRGMPRCLRIGWFLALIASLPLFATQVNGAGHELFNCALIFACGYLGYRMLEAPEVNDRDVILWLLLSWLLMNARYESVLFAGSTGLLLLVRARRDGRLPAFWLVLLTPVFLLLYLFRHRVFSERPEWSWQLRDTGASSPFALEHFSDNLGHAVAYFLVPSVQSSASVLLGCAGGVALLIFVVRTLRTLLTGERLGNLDLVLGAYGSVILLNFLLLLWYHWGQVDALEVSRLTLPFFLFLGVCVFRVLNEVEAKRPYIVRIGLVFAMAYVFLIALPSISDEVRLKHNYHAEIDRWAHNTIEQLDDSSPLIVSPSPLYWNLHGIPSLHPKDVRRRLAAFEFQRSLGSFNGYFLEKRQISLEAPDGQSEEAVDLGKYYHLETIAEYPYKPYHFARLSRITGPRVEVEKYGFPPPERDLEYFQAHPIPYWFFQIP